MPGIFRLSERMRKVSTACVQFEQKIAKETFETFWKSLNNEELRLPHLVSFSGPTVAFFKKAKELYRDYQLEAIDFFAILGILVDKALKAETNRFDLMAIIQESAQCLEDTKGLSKLGPHMPTKVIEKAIERHERHIARLKDGGMNLDDLRLFSDFVQARTGYCGVCFFAHLINEAPGDSQLKSNLIAWITDDNEDVTRASMLKVTRVTYNSFQDMILKAWNMTAGFHGNRLQEVFRIINDALLDALLRPGRPSNDLITEDDAKEATFVMYESHSAKLAETAWKAKMHRSEMAEKAASKAALKAANTTSEAKLEAANTASEAKDAKIHALEKELEEAKANAPLESTPKAPVGQAKAGLKRKASEDNEDGGSPSKKAKNNV